MADLRELINVYTHAKAAFDAADPDCDEPEWNAYEAAEHAIIIYPCRTLDEVRHKARFFLENSGPFDTIHNCYTTTEATLLPFLRSLLGEEGAA